MQSRAVTFEVFGGVPSSPTGPERLPVVVYDESERSELRPGPLLPDISRRVAITRHDNPDACARLTDYAFTRACAEVIRALVTGYTLWQDPAADAAPRGVENLVHLEFRAAAPHPAVTGPALHPAPHALKRHGVVYSPHRADLPSGALCWTSTTVQAIDGELLTLYAYISAPPPPEPLRSRQFPIITCQEGDALFRAAADGHLGRIWRTDERQPLRRYVSPGLRHTVHVELTAEEASAGAGAAILEELTEAQDADACLALMYVSRLLAPPSPLPANVAAIGWVELDDVAARVWPAPRSRDERRRQRQRVYRYLLFGERAHIVGRRSGRYVDRRTGAEIDTRIEGPIWRIMGLERGPGALRAGLDAQEPPRRVEIAVSPAWTLVTSHPNLAQYLPCGELLGCIPANRPSGAWARVIGLALAGFWRRHPQAAFDASLRPSRRELLLRYTPHTADPAGVLEGNDPGRAIGYWRSALEILAELGFIARTGEAARSLSDLRRGRPRYDWQGAWLDEAVLLAPGERTAPAVDGLIARLSRVRR